MKLTIYLLLALMATTTFCLPVTQPVYPNNQFISAQTIPALQYRQQQQQAQTYQPQYTPARQVYESDRAAGLQKYSTQIKQPIQQVLVPSNVDRQVQRVAQTAGPLYLQQIQAAQQRGQAQEAFDNAQRKAALGRPVQPVPQPQYLREAPQQTQVQYTRPVAQGYRQPEQAQEQQNPEDYDPNPSYQFGFDVNDDLYTNYQNRKEQREGNKITGSYSVVDSDGFVRTVTYTADPKEGFKAEVTRQPTDIVVKIPKPDPQFNKPQQYAQQVAPVQQHQQQRAQEQRPNVVYQYE